LLSANGPSVTRGFLPFTIFPPGVSASTATYLFAAFNLSIHENHLPIWCGISSGDIFMASLPQIKINIKSFMIQVLNEECDNNLMTMGGCKSGQIMNLFLRGYSAV